MILLFVPIFLISVSYAQQQGPDYHNDFQHNQRYDRVQSSEVISPTPVKASLNPEDEDPLHQQHLNTRRGSRTFSYEEVEDDGSYDGSLVDTIPGKAGKDYPAYAEIPKTTFTCDGTTPSGYFADVETDCQVFHICLEGGQKISFLCPNGSIFNQKVSVCDWWYDVDCSETQNIVDFTNDIQRNQHYHDNNNENENNNNININHNNNYNGYQHFIVEETYDLNLASSGGNQHPHLETKQKEQENLAVENKKKEQQSEAKKKLIRKKSSSPSSEGT